MKSKLFAIPSLLFAIIFILTTNVNVFAADFTVLVNACEDCHGKDGVSTDDEIPIIGGLSAPYITDSFTSYQSKTRPCEKVKTITGSNKGKKNDMCKATEKLSKQDIKQLADYYAAKPFVRAKQSVDASLIKKGEGVHNLQCKKCHEAGGSSADDDGGILAGQWMHYMQEQFEDYAAGKREMPKKMKVKMDKLSKDDIKALINYYASFK